MFFTFFHFFVNARISAGFCPFSLIFSANDSIFRAEHAQLVRTAYFLSKTRDLRGAQKSEKSGKTPNDNFSQVSYPPSKQVVFFTELIEQPQRVKKNGGADIAEAL